MPIELPTELTPELVPLSWLLGTWEGAGRLGAGEDEDEHFVQKVVFTQNGLPYLQYTAESWLTDEDGNRLRPLTVETGFWALDRELNDADVGPGLVPADIVPALKSADEVEELRNADGGFDITATIVHPGGISEPHLRADQRPARPADHGHGDARIAIQGLERGHPDFRPGQQ